MLIILFFSGFRRPGSVLLSRDLSQSTIGAKSFHSPVRYGKVCVILAKTTKSSKTAKSQNNEYQLISTNMCLTQYAKLFGVQSHHHVIDERGLAAARDVR